jgi:threonine synthase
MEMSKLIERGVIPRDESVVICINGNGLKTPDAFAEKWRPTSPSRRPGRRSIALADLKIPDRL